MPANTPDVCRRYSRRPGANRCGISFASPASSPAASAPPSACVRQTTTSKTGLGEDCECNRPAGSEASRHVSNILSPLGRAPARYKQVCWWHLSTVGKLMSATPEALPTRT